MTASKTDKLGLPFIVEAQAQKHVTHNEALVALDALVQLAVNGVADTPPPAPVAGESWLVGSAPGGAWADHADTVATWTGDGAGGWWRHAVPAVGWRAWDAAVGSLRVWTGTAWDVAGGGGPVTRVDRLGVNADADATNRLAVAGDATLLTHGADGDHRIVVNKATEADTASLLFQTGWSGRAEMGTAGSGDFAVKVAASDGTWRTGLSIDRETGVVACPMGLRVPMRVEIGGAWACHPDRRWVTFGSRGTTSSDYDTPLGTAAEPAVVFGPAGPPVPAGSRLLQLAGWLRATDGAVGGIDLRVAVDRGPADGSAWDDAAATRRDVVAAIDGLAVGSGWTDLSVDLGGWSVPDGGMVMVMMRPTGAPAAQAWVHGAVALRWETGAAI